MICCFEGICGHSDSRNRFSYRRCFDFGKNIELFEGMCESNEYLRKFNGSHQHDGAYLLALTRIRDCSAIRLMIGQLLMLDQLFSDFIRLEIRLVEKMEMH